MDKNLPLTAIVVDDEPKSRENLAILITDFCPGVEVVAMAESVDEGLQLIEELDPDLVFLDIQMHAETGFDLLRRISKISFEVIFTTAYSEYAIEAIRFSALDYLLKPIDIAELKQAVNKAKNKKSNSFLERKLENLIENFKNNRSDSLKIALPTADGLIFINVADISFLEAEGSYTNFHLNDKKKYLVTKSLKEYESMLVDKNFFRIHNSYLINLNEIERYVRGEGGYVVMKNGQHLDVSKRRKNAFLKKIG
jgi:two-component system LytT family response regulator